MLCPPPPPNSLIPMTRTRIFKTPRLVAASAVVLGVIMMAALAPTTWAIGGLANDTTLEAGELSNTTNTLRLRGRALPIGVPSNDMWARCVSAVRGGGGGGTLGALGARGGG